MKDQARKFGLDVLSEAPWGTHLCHFYDTKEDLIDTLVPYFKAGLENNEFCMWVTAEPLKVDDAKASLGKAVENLDDYIERGQIEILDYSQWYTRSGQFNADEVLQGWVEKLDQALQRGFDGLRLSGNTFWLEKRDWADFAEYEASIDNVIGKYRMLAICSYSLGRCGPYEIIDVVKNHEFAIVKRHGTWEVFESAGRRRMKKELYKQRDLLDMIVNSVPAMIWTKNAEGKYLQVNRAYCETVGLSEEKIINRTDYDLYPTDIATQYSKYDQEIINSKKPVSGIEERHLKPSGDYGWSLTEKLPYYDDKGNVVGTIGFALDITERKCLEAQVIQSSKMASLGIMAGGIAHEIRNPLAVCSSAAQLIVQNPNNRVLREECADKIYSNAHRAGHIIDNLLRFTQTSGDDFRPVNFNEVLELSLSLMEQQFKTQQIELNRKFAKDLPRVMGNVDLLQQVFFNLILNAYNAMPKGEKLTVSTLANSDGDVEVRFADNGCGIPEENLDKIFDPFFTTMPAGKGTGLGLSMSYEIIQQHGGSIEVESRVDVGSTFTIKLPSIRDKKGKS